ncbi:hypothetical protein WR25_25583 [Diploscapter pachys]|uniref:Uncharacterized protein n=1 Tax=Diploscapter pachys TaxID=2018661 RepID=A0A2A2K337_9BILA|nr:hypothetical protein WR25_25583 [Diploscapter pachys]
MGAVFPALDTHALAGVQLAQRAGVAPLLQAIAKHEENPVELLPAQVVSQRIGATALGSGTADEGQQEHPVIEFLAVAFTIGELGHLTGGLRKQRSLAQLLIQTLPQARPHCPHHGQVDLAQAQPGLQRRLVKHLAFVQHAGERQDLRPRRHVEQSRAVQLLRPALTVETDEVGRGRLRAKAQEPG